MRVLKDSILAAIATAFLAVTGLGTLIASAEAMPPEGYKPIPLDWDR